METTPNPANSQPADRPLDALVQGGTAFFSDRGWAPFPFQLEAWRHFEAGGDALVNAPTGSGKTYSALVPAVLGGGKPGGLRVLWITPIRALAKEIHGSASRLLDHQDAGWSVEVRTGDTPPAQKQRGRAPA